MSTTRFHASDRFPFTRTLEQHWREIHREFLGIRGQLVDWVERELYGEGWKVFGLFDFPSGEPIAAGVARCPFTAMLVQQHVPGHGTVGFSVLQPRTRIQPHQGYQGAFLRCHLGLYVPQGDCRLKLEEESRGWETGKTLVFDDRGWHEAWNLTDQERVVLLLDFIP
jgi:aspartyl/asparaginyl beta-hydroxylase (cupin superfamily)